MHRVSQDGPISPTRHNRRTSPPSPYPISTSPNRRLSGPSRGYAFPPSPVSQPTEPRISVSSINPSQRYSISSNRARRPSPLLHEIQPPSRRLSSHQMLLLTPFGGPLPIGALPEGSGQGTSMGRGSSGMGRASNTFNPTLMAAQASSIARPPSRHPRPRHRSLGLPSLIGSSPLTSATLATIPSNSDGDSSGPGSASCSRGPSNQSQQSMDIDGKVPSLVGDIPGTVPMMRSNSLPVLTLRELIALKEKDGELGIARGGGWAWVAREEDV